jgi:aminomethyltransferase
MAAPTLSPLYDVQKQAGAEFEDFDGWQWTAHLGDTAGEYEAIRTATGLWDVYPLIKWDVRGADAARAIQRVYSNDIVSLPIGAARYGALVNPDGTMYDDGTVYRAAEGRLFLMTNNPGYEERFAELFGGLDVSVDDRTFDMPLISVQGPTSREVLQPLVDRDLSELRYFRFWPERVGVAGVPAWVFRTGFSGELGFELIPDREDAVAVWEALVQRGARPFGTEAIEIARVEAGLVVAGVDYEPDVTSPWDLSFDRFIDTNTGSIGAAALAAAGEDPPNRFVTLEIGSDTVPEYGAAVSKSGEPVGVLTSPTASPRLGVIGLAILRSDEAIEENTVDVATGDDTAPATVKPLSLYDPDKTKPRA